jgi:hypothetical protein
LPTANLIYRGFRAGDVRHSLADISKGKKLLGYRPSYRIDEGLQEALGWYVRPRKYVSKKVPFCGQINVVFYRSKGLEKTILPVKSVGWNSSGFLRVSNSIGTPVII